MEYFYLLSPSNLLILLIPVILVFLIARFTIKNARANMTKVFIFVLSGYAILTWLLTPFLSGVYRSEVTRWVLMGFYVSTYAIFLILCLMFILVYVLRNKRANEIITK